VEIADVQVETVTGEPGVVGKRELAPHTVEVHVLEPRDRVVAARPDLVEPGGAGSGREPGLGEPLQGSTRAHRDVGQLVFVRPCLAAVDLDDAGAAVAERRRHPIDPQVRRLDHVVVGGDGLGAGRQHRSSPQRWWSRAAGSTSGRTSAATRRARSRGSRFVAGAMIRCRAPASTKSRRRAATCSGVPTAATLSSSGPTSCLKLPPRNAAAPAIASSARSSTFTKTNAVHENSSRERPIASAWLRTSWTDLS